MFSRNIKHFSNITKFTKSLTDLEHKSQFNARLYKYVKENHKFKPSLDENIKIIVMYSAKNNILHKTYDISRQNLLYRPMSPEYFYKELEIHNCIKQIFSDFTQYEFNNLIKTPKYSHLAKITETKK